MANDQVIDYAEIEESEDHSWHWRAKSNNGKIVAVGGEPFDSMHNAFRAVVAVFPNLDPYKVYEISLEMKKGAK